MAKKKDDRQHTLKRKQNQKNRRKSVRKQTGCGWWYCAVLGVGRVGVSWGREKPDPCATT